MTKHVGRACGDLWGQSMILEAVHGNCPGPDGVQGITNGIRADS